MIGRSLRTLMLLIACSPLVKAQPAPGQGPAPLVYVRFGGQSGMRITYHAGSQVVREVEAAAAVGLRPGYTYRVEVSRFPQHPGVKLYPTLEVRGTLHLPSQQKAADYPATIPLSEDDVSRVLAGGYITKVIYLEHPEKARPEATLPDRHIETSVGGGQDPVDEARLLGRPMLVVRLGGRTSTHQELAAMAVPNTILLPGEKSLGMPASPPHVPWNWCQLYDPLLGPKPPEEECFHDGGDQGWSAGLDRQGRLGGLDPADTVAVYSDSKGAKHVAVSNRVCICVPRFAVIRQDHLPASYDATTRARGTGKSTLQALVQVRTPSLVDRHDNRSEHIRRRMKPSAAETSTSVAIQAQMRTRAVVSGRQQDRNVVGQIDKTASAPDRPLLLSKSVNVHSAQVGDVVTFTLKFTNQGGQPISDIVVADSLSGRLEYVPGSSKSDRDAIFTMVENQAGSMTLRWEVRGALQPGQTGTVSFQAKVR